MIARRDVLRNAKPFPYIPSTAYFQTDPLPPISHILALMRRSRDFPRCCSLPLMLTTDDTLCIRINAALCPTRAPVPSLLLVSGLRVARCLLPTTDRIYMTHGGWQIAFPESHLGMTFPVFMGSVCNSMCFPCLRRFLRN